jgi:large subunit ribosomal protein L21
MKYAVIKTGGKQYKVSEGDVIEIDRILNKDGKVVFDEVLLVSSDAGVKIGKPTVENAKVEAKVLEDLKGEKIRVSKFKSKVRYRRVTGFRAFLTKVQIEKIIEGVRLSEAKSSKAGKIAAKKS